MRMIKCLGLLAMTLFCFSACKKKNPTEVVNNYYTTNTVSPSAQQKISLPITIGSYWIYDIEMVDVNTQARTYMGRDSLVVENEVVVNTKSYKQVKKYSVSGNVPQIGDIQEGQYRDSAGYNVTPNGTYFDQSDFTKTVIRNITGGTIETKLLNSGKLILLYGEFNNSVNSCSKYYPVSGSAGVRYLNNYYSDKIGLVQATAFFLSDTDHFIERSLIRYQIK